MIDADTREMTKEEIAEMLGVKVPSVTRALEELDIKGYRDWNDRRRVVYPPGSAAQVRQWLLEHR